MVTRVHLHKMHQDHDEPIREFGARLWGQAAPSGFTIKFPNCNQECRLHRTDDMYLHYQGPTGFRHPT